MPYHADLTTELIVDVAKHAKQSASGFDSWSIDEIKALPSAAWDLLRRIFVNCYDSMEKELVTLVKRVVLEKHDGLCSETEVRPIDIYSLLMRVISSATYRLARPWACQVLYPNQYATQGGALKAVAKLAWHTELSQCGLSNVYSVASDFSKMFNMMSVDLASASARYMGLSEQLVSLLAKPIKGSAFSWKLPYDAKPLEVMHERGLPQGLAGSVLLAECMIAPLLWRCHQIVREDCKAVIVAYVDDLNFILPSRDMLMRISELIFQYRDHLFLDLSLSKSALWATHPTHLKDESAHLDIPITKTLVALGAEWPVTKDACPTHEKELARYEEAEKRLIRIRHMPIGVSNKIAIISSTCLSTLDYVNHPELSSVRYLRSLVKKALAQQYAAPEVLYNCFVSSTIDPCIRWLLAGLRLCHLIIQEEEVATMLQRVLAGTGRIARVARLAVKNDIHVTPHGLLVGEVTLPRSHPWAIVRSKLLEHLKAMQLTQLAERRPNTFGGLRTCAYKAHRRFMLSKPDYEQAVLLKLWTGSIMTREKHAKMGEGDGLCECGETQSVHHILWSCPLTQPPPPLISYLSEYPPHMSVALILPQGADPRDVQHWKMACNRAIDILGRRVLQREHVARHSTRERDMRGHLAAVTSEGHYTYCMRCFISRRSRDAAWIFTKPCAHADRDPLPEGGEIVQNGHACVLRMERWKTSSQRPRLVCTRCGQRVWATMGFKKSCRAQT